MPGVKKEQIDAAAEKALPALQEIGRADLFRDDAVYFLGLMAAKGLAAFGMVTLTMGVDDKVCIANPVHVYLDAQAMVNDDVGEDQLSKFKWVRPILGSGRPQYTAWRNGELWEIEFTNEPEEESGSGDHQ
jgi:hypothetical protein